MGKRADKEVLIIIPAYNEEKNIRKVLEDLQQRDIQSLADVLVMNDASADETNWIVKRSSFPHKLVTHVFNLGYGSALQLGYKYAIRRGYRYVIQMDADGQHDVCNIPKIYEALTSADEQGKTPDIVLCSRYMEGSGIYQTTVVKRLAHGLFQRMIRLFSGRWITDTTTGLQGLNWSAVLYYSKYGHFDDQYPDANMILQMLLLGFRVKEIPAVMHPRVTGKSMHSGYKPFVYMFRMFFSMIAIYVRVRMLRLNTGGCSVDEFYDRNNSGGTRQ
ncbi:MAG: glycosyltransferase family 2 protein [Eubacterium sp.]|nr:glycosyltransferase family 2 protein [Eubacterium sp.]